MPVPWIVTEQELSHSSFQSEEIAVHVHDIGMIGQSVNQSRYHGHIFKQLCPWTSRKNNHLKKLIKQAKLAEPDACVEDIEYHADRNMDQTQIARLSTCNFIAERHNILLLGATGSGKTYIPCALGMVAVRSFLRVRYVRLPKLLTELAIARGNGTYPKIIQQYKKPALLILDKWLLYPLKKAEARDLLDISEARYKKASTIFCSQFDVPGWREKIGEPILADAICDRIVHDSYSIVIDCKESMRKRKGIKENEA